ncbi:MAG: branched-chain amino acid ABC transporter permease [Proteobacteria bacterium]|nr:branched-chain amino acid ABC transporter permease [Pseudomonadota bacterium]MBU1740764.1 branched-chain amino acid ABC transporter permease [Pseudomonadota bacterium]
MRGCIYALLALGWVLIYKCSGVLNLAMGELTLIGGYVCWQFNTVFFNLFNGSAEVYGQAKAVVGTIGGELIGVLANPEAFTALPGFPFTVMGPFLLALLATLIIGLILGVLTERVFLDKMIGEPILAVIMVTVGLSFFFNGIVKFIWATNLRPFSPTVFTPGSGLDLLGVVQIEPVYLVAFPVVLVLLLIFMTFFQRTRWGLSMQATADDEMAALSLGVSARFVYAAAWSIAFMAAGVAGTMMSHVEGGVSGRVAFYGLLVLPAVVLGGLNSIPGAVVGGVSIGVMEMLCSVYLSQVRIGNVAVLADVSDWGPLVFMAVFLLYKPFGLWGWERIERV